MRINLTDNNIGQVKAGTFLRKDDDSAVSVPHVAL